MASTRQVTMAVKVTAEFPWAWEHQCGHLNKGPWHQLKMCGGCRFEASADEIHRYLLVDVDSEPGEDA